MKIPDASGETILAAAEAIYYTTPDFSISSVAEYMNTKDLAVAKEAIEAAALLGFVQERQKDFYFPIDDILRLETHADAQGRRTVFRIRLESLAPYKRFKERIYCGDSPLEAARRVGALGNIDTEPIKIKEIFQRLGLFAGSFTQDGIGNLVCSSGEQSIGAYLDAVKSSLISAESARTFIERRVGEEPFRFLPSEALDNLTSMLARCQAKHEPKSEMIFALGTAVEKFLRKIGDESNPPVDLTKTNGVTQMADELRKGNVITKKHYGLLQAIAAMRNAANHGIDNDIGKAWAFTHETISDVGLLTLDTIRSIFDWTNRQSAIL